MTTQPVAKKTPTARSGRAASVKKAAKTSARPATATKAASRPAAKPTVKTAPAKAVKAAAPAKAPKVAADKQKKPKLVRDSFTMPENEYALISQVKKACIGAGFEIKKSELLRIGIALLAKMEPKKLKLAQQALVPLKAGRPKKK